MARDGDIAEDDCSTDDRKSDSIPAMNGQSHNGITSACDVAAPLISQPGVTALCHSKGLLPSPATTILAEDSTSCSSSGSHHSLQPRTAPGDDGEEMTVKLPDIASSSEANGVYRLTSSTDQEYY